MTPMTFAALAQALTEAPTHTKEVYGLAGIFITQLGIYFANNRKGKARDRSAVGQLDTITGQLGTLSHDLQDLRAYVIGPDGQNGLRGDVKALTVEVQTLREDVTDLQIAEARHSQGGR